MQHSENLPFTWISLGRYLWNYFQFRGNKLRKEDKKKKEVMEKYLIKSHTGTEGRGRETRLPERQIECLRSMRFIMCVMCSHESTRHCTCWVVIGGLPGKGGRSSALPLGHPPQSEPALIGTAHHPAHGMHLRRAQTSYVNESF